MSYITTTDVRDAWVYASAVGDADWTADRAYNQFNAWLAEHDTQVWEDGMAAGHECVGAERTERCQVRNPYRTKGGDA